MPRKKKQPTAPPPPEPQDNSFVPASYWTNLSVGQTIVHSIRGVARRESAEKALEEGTLEELPDFVLQDRLTDRQRLSLSRIHPSLMGGEYLPDHLPGEVTIASVWYGGSFCRDVDEIRASLRGGYRWVGESWEGRDIEEDNWTPDVEEGEAEDALPPENFCDPVSQDTLADWIIERILEILNDNHYNGGVDWEDLRGFASVSSDHYPTLADQCKEAIDKSLWEDDRDSYQAEEIKELTEELESVLSVLAEDYNEIATDRSPELKLRRAQIEAEYGRTALFLKLLSPDPNRFWEVFGPWSDVQHEWRATRPSTPAP
jgi:hypothetical protein